MSGGVKIRSRAGVLKPISPAQLDALAVIETGIAYYRPWFGGFMGVRTDTYEVLERNGLVKTLGEPANPDQPERRHRFPVALTDAGRAALKAVQR